MRYMAIPMALMGLYAGAVQGQTNVSVYGIVDEFVEFSSNGSNHNRRLQSGGINGSRIGFKGAEALGGGMNAIFTLETGLNADDGSLGQGGLLFGRQAFVGLESSVGTVTLGRQYPPLFYTLAIYGLGGGLAWGNASNYYVDGSVLRLNNSINYVSPSFGGVVARGAYALGEVAGSTSTGSAASASLQYDAGAISLNLSHLQRKTSATVTDRYTGVGAAYDFGIAKAALLYQNRRNDIGTVKNAFYEVGVSIPLQSSALLLDYGWFKNKRAANGDSKALSVRYDYYLSKRTTIYGGVAKIRNEAGAAFGIAGATSAPAPLAAGDDPRSLIVGVRHTF